LTLGEFSLDEAPSSVPILDDYATTWLATYATHNCKESTYERYAGVVRKHLSPFFGSTPLTDITRDDIKRLIYQKRETAGLTPSSIKQILAPLREMLNHAIEDGLVTSNPVSRIGRFVQRPQEVEEQIDPLTREELALFLDTMQVWAPEHYPFFLCLARTGMRLGEALALQWGDIDWRGGFIEMRRNYVCGKITRPKSGKNRRVDMSQQLSEALRQLLTQRKAEKLEGKWAELPEWVFCNTKGGIHHSNNLRRRVFYPCLEKAGLRRVRIHDLRHTFASLLIQQGESLAYVRDQLGHHSIQITVDTYGHLVPGGNRAAVDRLDDTTIRNLSATKTKGQNA
jgi:integrase